MESIKPRLISQANERSKPMPGDPLELKSATSGQHAANRGIEGHHGEAFYNGLIPICL
jgi:hypothetical protein